MNPRVIPIGKRYPKSVGKSLGNKVILGGWPPSPGEKQELPIQKGN